MAMTASRASTKDLWPGILWVLGLPVLALVLLAGFVLLANRTPQRGPLTVRVQPQVVLPWQQAHFLVTVTGSSPGATVAAEPLDIVFAVDVSGSMTESTRIMAVAAQQAAAQLAALKGRTVRFALISFDEPAKLEMPWTGDAAVFANALANIDRRSGENDSRELFERIDEVLKTSRPEARRAIVFYTDGVISTCSTCLRSPMSYTDIAAAGERLRNSGVDLYCVSPPGDDVHPVMREVTGATSRIFRPADTNDLAANFAALTTALSGLKQTGAQLANRIDGRFFRAPLEGTRWIRDPTGTLRLDIGVLPKTPTTYGHPLKPMAAGLWRVGTGPARLTYVDDSGRALEARATYRPRILVITWLALLLPLLPWLIWLLFHLPQAARARGERPLLPIRPPLLPTALPALPARRSPVAPLPTLFIGLGRTGLEALRAMRADLKQLHLGLGGQEYRFLALDVDQRPPEPSRFDDWLEHPIVPVVAPPEIARAADYLPKPGEVPPHLAWLDAGYYEHHSKEDLNLANGAKGDRVLARLALVRWLGDAKTPLAALEPAVNALMKSPVDARQIVIVASPDGGVGSGWFVDVGRVLRRLIRDRQADHELIPEIVGVLVSSGDSHGGGNRAALRFELESAALTGEFPRSVAIKPGDPLLDRKDSESPFDWMIEVRDADAASAAAQSGALAALLSQRLVRQELLRALAGEERGPAAAATSGLHVVSTIIRDHVQADLMLRLLGPDLLLDVQPVRGGYQPRSVSADEAQQALDRWRAKEPRGTPLHGLIALAADPAPASAAVTDFASAAGAIDARASGQWVAPALRASVNRLLHGSRSGGGARWARDWQPVLGAAALRLFADRLGGLSAPTPAADAALQAARRWAVSAAEGLDGVVRDLAAVAAETAERRRALSSQIELLRSLRQRTYLDPAVDAKEIEEASRASLERWLGSADTLSPLRERLFFEVAPDGRVLLRSFIRGQQTLGAAEAAAALREITAALASTALSLRLSAAVSRLPEDERRRLAAELAGGDLRPDAVIVAAPPPETPSGPRDEAMERFRDAVPQPAEDGPRRDVVAEDVSALRRLAVGYVVGRPGGAPLRFVELAEQASEQLRNRIEQRYYVRVPSFPARLRVAAANQERFRLFARAYKEGRIVRKEDEDGLARWYDLDAQEFLSCGGQSDLSAAAANYVWYGGAAAPGAAPAAAGDFSALEEWRGSGREMTADELALAAIEVADES